MDDRFTDAFMYTSGVPIKKLAFDVTIFRTAQNGPEGDAEVVAQKKIHWGQKLPSPEEAIEWFDHKVVSKTNPPPAFITDNGANIDLLLEELKACPTREGNDPESLAGKGDQLLYHVNSNGRLFTLPPSADWVNPAEEDSQLEPEQEPTPLAHNYLIRHRKRQEQSPYMHISFALGGATQGANGGKWKWQGHDVVVTTLKIEDDGVFTARPSLGEPHTLYYDHTDLYTFLVTIAPNQPGVGASVNPSGNRRGTVAAIDASELLRKKASMLLSATSFIKKMSMKKGGGKGGNNGSVNESTMITNPDLTAQDSVLNLNSSTFQPSNPDTGPAKAANTADDREKLALLKSVIRQSQAMGKVKKSIADFVKPPAKANRIKLHVMGTIERVRGIQQDYVFVRVTLQPPNGAEEDRKVNQRAGVSHMTTIVSSVATACRLVNKDNQHETVHTFNLPFDFHMEMDENADPAQLNVEVFSGGFEGTYEAAEGYGCIRCTTVPGQESGEAGLWMPAKTGYEKLKSVFVGGGPSLAHTDDISAIRSRGATQMDARKAGLVTESVGAVEYKIMKLVQQKSAAMAKGMTTNIGLDQETPREMTPRTPRGRRRM